MLTTWKSYSTEKCDRTMTDKMIQFALFCCFHQAQPKVWLIVECESLSSLGKIENQGQRPGKYTPPQTVTKR